MRGLARSGLGGRVGGWAGGRVWAQVLLSAVQGPLLAWPARAPRWFRPALATAQATPTPFPHTDVSTDKVWWVQAEASLAMWQLYRRRGDCGALLALEGTLEVWGLGRGPGWGARRGRGEGE